MAKLSQEQINADLFDEVKRLKSENKALRMDKEDMYFLAQRAHWYESDWEDFERILNKNKER